MSGLLGKKIRMTQVFDDKGNSIPVTVVNAGPCYVSQIKSEDNDGYRSVQIGFTEMKDKHANKPISGHLKKANLKPLKYLREFNLPLTADMNPGDELKVDMFREGEEVIISGYAKGRGFQGVMKRHGFHGAQKTHGQSDRQRAPGSIGQSSDPSRVLRGTKMAGKKGNNRITISRAQIVKIDTERNLLFIKGPIPGGPNSLIEIKKT